MIRNHVPRMQQRQTFTRQLRSHHRLSLMYKSARSSILASLFHVFDWTTFGKRCVHLAPAWRSTSFHPGFHSPCLTWRRRTFFFHRLFLPCVVYTLHFCWFVRKRWQKTTVSGEERGWWESSIYVKTFFFSCSRTKWFLKHAQAWGDLCKRWQCVDNVRGVCACVRLYSMSTSRSSSSCLSNVFFGRGDHQNKPNKLIKSPF